jgi:hypothetical protein
LFYIFLFKEDVNKYRINKSSFGKYYKTKHVASQTNDTFEQYEQLPQGMMKDPTTRDPIGYLKSQEYITNNLSCLLSPSTKIIIFYLNILGQTLLYRSRGPLNQLNITAPFYCFGVCKWPMLNDFTSYLMPHNTRASKWKFTFHNMEIRVTDSTGCNQR